MTSVNPSVEDGVKERIKAKLESEGFNIKKEIAVVDSGRNVVLDFYAYRDPPVNYNLSGIPAPEIYWVECKGDVNLSELIEGFARLEFALFYGGGKGIFAAPKEQIDLMKEYEEFFNQVRHIKLEPV